VLVTLVTNICPENTGVILLYSGPQWGTFIPKLPDEPHVPIPDPSLHTSPEEQAGEEN